MKCGFPSFSITYSDVSGVAEAGRVRVAFPMSGGKVGARTTGVRVDTGPGTGEGALVSTPITACVEVGTTATVCTGPGLAPVHAAPASNPVLIMRLMDTTFLISRRPFFLTRPS
jgi:hypothetical protein